MKINSPKAFGLETILHHGSNHATALVFQLIASIFVARNLGPTALGELAIIQTVLILLRPLLDIGTRGYLLRELINHPSYTQQAQWARAANKLSTKISILIFIIVIVGVFVEKTLLPTIINKPNLWAYCLGFVILANTFENKGFTQILLLKDTKAYLRRNLVINIYSALAKLLCAFTIESSSLLISCFFTIVGGEYILRGLYNRLDLQTGGKAYGEDNSTIEKQKKLFKEAINYLPSEVALASEGELPKIWLAGLDTGTSTLGNYTAAQKNGILFKTLNRISHDSDLKSPSLKVGLKYAMLGAMLSAITAPIIPLIYGEAFENATYYAYLLIAPSFLSSLGFKISSKLIRHSMTISASRINIVGVVISLILCSILIPNYGVVGASAALCAGWISQICLGVWLLNNHKTKVPIS